MSTDPRNPKISTLHHPQRRRLPWLALLLLALSGLLRGPVSAQVPIDETLTFQGQIRQSGSALNGSYDLRFFLFDDAGPGTGALLGSVTKSAVAVSDGMFDVALDFPAGSFDGDQRWLEIGVRPAGSGSFETLSPRIEVTATPYAIHALEAVSADSLGGFAATDFVDLTSNQDVNGVKTFLDRVDAEEGIWVGTTTDGSEMRIYTAFTALDFFRVGGSQFGEIRTNSANDFVLQPHTGRLRTQSDLYLQNADGQSFRDLFADIAYLHDGLVLNDGSGQEVGDIRTSADDLVLDTSQGGDVEVRARLLLAGQSDEYISFGPSGSNNVILGEGPSVIRDLDLRMGTSSDGTFRIFGDLDVQGTVSKLAGSFRIDHPLDPENRYLYHSFVESPEMMNVYNGNVTTDEHGEATVELPSYFGALNRDFRYQLTPIGVFAQAIVSEEIVDNRFSIRTDQPHVKVSWQVTGVRDDAWARDHRIEPEVDKPPRERGTYLYSPARQRP